MKALGPVEGGPLTVLRALQEALGPAGTLLVPTFTTHLTDPILWPVPPPPEERQRIMAEMEPFDPVRSKPHKMGIIATTMLELEGVVRSRHPVTSWAGLGPRARELLWDHPLDDPEGPEGPLGRALRAGGQVLLLGVDHDANTTVHLAECLLDMPHLEILPDRYPTVDASGNRVWRAVRRTTKCSDGFVKLGPHLRASGSVRQGTVGNAPALLVAMRDVVRVAATLLASDPTALLCDDPTCVHCPFSRSVLADWHPAPTCKESLRTVGIGPL